MKYLIASDLHGSAKYIGQLVQQIRIQQPDQVILLGDLLYHGPRNKLPDGYDPVEASELINSFGEKVLFCVRGNCDAEVDQTLIKFPIMSEYETLDVGSHRIFFTHGHHYNAENLPPIGSCDTLIHGHTHIPCRVRSHGVLVCNPGSVSIPKGDSERGYLVLENETLSFFTLEGKCYCSIGMDWEPDGDPDSK